MVEELTTSCSRLVALPELRISLIEHAVPRYVEELNETFAGSMRPNVRAAESQESFSTRS